MFANRLLRSKFGPKRDEVTGGWRKMRFEELHDLYSSQSIIRIITLSMRLEEHFVEMQENRSMYRKARGNETTRKTNNIKIDLVEIGWGDVDWIGLT
jgi:hypothetical protein